LKFTAEVEPTVLISASRLEVVTSFSGHPSSGYISYVCAAYFSPWSMRWSDTHLQIKTGL